MSDLVCIDALMAYKSGRAMQLQDYNSCLLGLMYIDAFMAYKPERLMRTKGYRSWWTVDSMIAHLGLGQVLSLCCERMQHLGSSACIQDKNLKLGLT